MPPDRSNRGLESVRFQLRAVEVVNADQNPLRSGFHSRGYLPHVKRENASYFVTFRLADSLPREVLLRFEREQAEALHSLPADAVDKGMERVRRKLRHKVERYLDLGAGECYLRRPEIADLVAAPLLHFDRKHYVLDDWVVIPNHVHIIVWPMHNFTLGEILRSRKRQTARQANLVSGRTGETFWQRESYDHWIRDDVEMRASVDT